MPNSEGDPTVQALVATLWQALARLGWSEGRNVRIDFRYAQGSAERAQAFAKELVVLQPDVILAHTTRVTAALQRASHTIPIVFVNVSDPIGGGFIANMARPGGNMTGFTTYESEIAGKRLELLKEVAPRLTRLGVLYTPGGGL